MNFSFLSPVSDIVVAHTEFLSAPTIGKKIKIHSQQQGIPDLETIKIALIGVPENRNDINYIGEEIHLDGIRKSIYGLYLGNWYTPIADLGDIPKGESVEDTYFALQTSVNLLLQKNIIPIVIGGTQDLTYPMYRAYDTYLPMVNLVNVDACFNLGDASKPIKNDSFVGKIILSKPYNLFSYTNIGYQTYFNSQEEIDLMEKLYFESYRLGEVSKQTTIVEPVLRDANIVSIDLSALKASEVSTNLKYSPNGLTGKEICTIARYAGISNNVSTLGIWEYKNTKNDDLSCLLIAQIIWYFIEGVNKRIKDDDFSLETNFQKYTTLAKEHELIFYKSKKTGRWWVELPFLEKVDNKLKRHTLLSCTHQNYIDACNNIIPERWYKVYQKNMV